MGGTGSDDEFLEEAYTPIERPDEMVEGNSPEGLDFENWYRVLEALPDKVIEKTHTVQRGTPESSEELLFVADWMEGLENELSPLELYREFDLDVLSHEFLQIVGLEEEIDEDYFHWEDPLADRYDGLTVVIYSHGFEAAFAIPVTRRERMGLIDDGYEITSFGNPTGISEVDYSRHIPGF